MASLSSRETILASLRELLDSRSPADALASYYVFHHPAHRAEIYVTADEQTNASSGFLVRAQTGMDLFRPLVTFRAPTPEVAQSLFQAGLPLGRPVYLTIPWEYAEWANKYLMISDAEIHQVYRLDSRHFQALVNVLAVTSTGPDGSPRCEIRAREGQGAVAGVNWQSPNFAEMYVHTDSAARGLGWGRSVVSYVAGELLSARRIPLYVVSESNQASISVAEAVGFKDTGLREFVAQAIRTG